MESSIRKALGGGAVMTNVAPLSDGRRIAVSFSDKTTAVCDVSGMAERHWLYAFLADRGTFRRVYAADDEMRWPTPPDVEWPIYVELTLDALSGMEVDGDGWIDDIDSGPGIGAVTDAISGHRFIAGDGGAMETAPTCPQR